MWLRWARISNCNFYNPNKQRLSCLHGILPFWRLAASGPAMMRGAFWRRLCEGLRTFPAAGSRCESPFGWHAISCASPASWWVSTKCLKDSCFRASNCQPVVEACAFMVNSPQFSHDDVLNIRCRFHVGALQFSTTMTFWCAFEMLMIWRSVLH